MLLYAIVTLIALIIVLFVMAIIIGRKSVVNPIERMMSEAPLDNEVSTEKSRVKQLRWSYKLTSFLFRKTIKETKHDPNRSMLAQADIEMSSEEYLLIRLLFTAAAGFFGFSVGHKIILALISAFIVWMIPSIVIKSRIRSKQKKFDDQLLDAVSVLSNSLKAGYSFFQALSSVVEESPSPLSKEFKIMLKEMSFGLGVDQAFESLMLRIYTEDLHLLSTCVLIQRDIGGNLSELLDNIGETIRERQKLNGELRALTAQGRMSGVVVSLLPVALAIAMYFINRDYIMLLFTTKPGNVMLIISVILQAIGIFAISKIIKVEL